VPRGVEDGFVAHDRAETVHAPEVMDAVHGW
jgi:hypothetical protein